LAAIIGVLSLVMATHARAQVHVNKGATETPRDGSACERGLETIQEAIEQAGEEGQIVVCDSSVYQESVVLKDGQTLQSAALPGDFSVETVEALCARGGLPSIQATAGSAVTTAGSKKPVLIRGFRIFGGASASGGGIRVDQAHDIDIVGCCVVFNQAESLGGGISLKGCGTARIDRCLVECNSSGARGGGIGAERVGRLHIERSIIRGNTSSTDGGGIAGIAVQHANVTGCRLDSNVCVRGNGAGEFWERSSDTDRQMRHDGPAAAPAEHAPIGPAVLGLAALVVLAAVLSWRLAIARRPSPRSVDAGSREA
jgi:hypothetical protein